MMCALFMVAGTNKKQSKKNYGMVKDKVVRRTPIKQRRAKGRDVEFQKDDLSNI